MARRTAAKPAATASTDATATTVPATPRRIVVTGGAGLVGRAVVQHLRERGDEVVALVRDPRRAPHLAELGAELLASDLSDVAELTEQLRGADGLIHAAGSYRIGIDRSERGAMWDANVGTTTRVLDAAEAAGTTRIVHVSTINVFGDTHGRVVDETYRRDLGEGFLSWYDETKYGAHEVAEQRVAGGARSSSSCPARSTARAIGPASAISSGGPTPGRSATGPSTTSGSGSSTPTTWRPGSSRPSIAVGSARPTS